MVLGAAVGAAEGPLVGTREGTALVGTMLVGALVGLRVGTTLGLEVVTIATGARVGDATTVFMQVMAMFLIDPRALGPSVLGLDKYR